MVTKDIPKKGTAEYKTWKDARRKAAYDKRHKEFADKVAKVKKEHSKEELLEIVQIQPFNHELGEFTAARKALDELKVEYPMNFKVQCEERDFNAEFGKVRVEKVPEEKPVEEEKPEEPVEEEKKN